MDRFRLAGVSRIQGPFLRPSCPMLHQRPVIPSPTARGGTNAAILTLAALFLAGASACDPSGPGRDAAAADSLPPAPAPGSPIDGSLVETGERLYRLKGCLACHKIGGGRAVGPDLAGVTRRRDYEWFAAMVLNPDSLLRTDTIARRLLTEYSVPMPDQRVEPAQVRALWEYLRSDP